MRIAAIFGLTMMLLIFATLADAHSISDATRKLSARSPALSSPLTLSWSPDGKKIAVGGKRGGQIYTVDFQNATGLELEGDEQDIFSIAWSPDGRLLAGAVGDNIYLWDANTGKKVALLTGLTSVIASVAWKPDGSAIAAGDQGLGDGNRDYAMFIWQTDNFQVLKGLEDEGPNQVTTVSWSPDGKRIVDNSGPLGVRIWDVNSGQILFHLREGSEVMCAAWSPVSNLIATAGADGPADLAPQRWDLQIWDGSTGKLLTTLGDNSEFFLTVKWNPHATQLAAVDREGTLTIWDVATKRPVVEFPGNDFGFGIGILVDFLTWDPDGQKVAVVTGDSHLRIWDVSSKALVADFSN